jgi:hypothetical protein
LRIKRLVCFGEKTWIRLKKVKGSKCSGTGKKGYYQKARGIKRPVNVSKGKERETGYFRIDGIRVSSWWKREKWDMVTDPENPFGDITREEERKVREILKGIG